MYVIAINGGPRKSRSTHILLEEAMKGAASKGAETERMYLYGFAFMETNLVNTEALS